MTGTCCVLFVVHTQMPLVSSLSQGPMADVVGTFRKRGVAWCTSSRRLFQEQPGDGQGTVLLATTSEQAEYLQSGLAACLGRGI